MPGYKNTDGRGQKPATNSLRYTSCNIGKKFLRFSFSEDMVEKLMLISQAGHLTLKNYQHIYLQIERYPYVAPHAALLRLTRMHDGPAFKLSKDPRGPRYRSEILARHFEVQPGVPGHKFVDIDWDHDRCGLMVQFPITSMTAEAQERWERIARWRQIKEVIAG